MKIQFQGKEIELEAPPEVLEKVFGISSDEQQSIQNSEASSSEPKK